MEENDNIQLGKFQIKVQNACVRKIDDLKEPSKLALIGCTLQQRVTDFSHRTIFWKTAINMRSTV